MHLPTLYYRLTIGIRELSIAIQFNLEQTLNLQLEDGAVNYKYSNTVRLI